MTFFSIQSSHIWFQQGKGWGLKCTLKQLQMKYGSSSNYLNLVSVNILLAGASDDRWGKLNLTGSLNISVIINTEMKYKVTSSWCSLSRVRWNMSRISSYQFPSAWLVILLQRASGTSVTFIDRRPAVSWWPAARALQSGLTIEHHHIFSPEQMKNESLNLPGLLIHHGLSLRSYQRGQCLVSFSFTDTLH